MKKNAVIYARFSSYNQTEQSIEGQLRECYDYAKRQDLRVVDEYIDRALTGTVDRRPSFLQMVEDSKKRSFDYILVYQLDRFARNRYDSASYKAKLKKNGVRVLSARENITDDASGILVEGMLESMAEYFSAELSQKVKRGVKESLIKGNFTGGKYILGYDIIDKKWVINEQEADVVREIYDKYKCGHRVKDIVNELNARCIKAKNGNEFSVTNIARIIKNIKYTGKIVKDDMTYYNIIPRIISDETFKKCNNILAGSKHRPRTSHYTELDGQNAYALSGKLYCGCCGYPITADAGTSSSGKRYQYYKCSKRKKNSDSCNKNSVSKNELESLVLDKTIEYVLKYNGIDKIAEMITKKYNQELEKSIDVLTLEQEVKNIEKSIVGIMQAIEQGVVTSTTGARLLELERKKEQAEEQLELLKARQAKPINSKIIKAFLSFYSLKNYDTVLARNEFYNSFVSKVILYDDRMIVAYNTGIDIDYDIDYDIDALKIEAVVSDCLEQKKSPSVEQQMFNRGTIGRTEKEQQELPNYYIDYKNQLFLVDFGKVI